MKKLWNKIIDRWPLFPLVLMGIGIVTFMLWASTQTTPESRRRRNCSYNWKMYGIPCDPKKLKN